MRNLLVLSLLLACGGGGTTETTSSDTAGSEAAELPDARTVTGPEARELVAGGALLLDVTPDARADESFIEGRTHIPISELSDRLGELDREQTIVAYCLGGGASRRGGAMLQDEGYDVFVLGAKSNWDAQ